MKNNLIPKVMAAIAVSILMSVNPGWADVLTVPVGKARIIELKTMPTVVMVGDPRIADVIIERNRQIFLIGLQPGETNMFILDDAGKTIMSVDLVVTRTVPRHVTVDRATSSSILSCNPRCLLTVGGTLASTGQSGNVGEEADEDEAGPALDATAAPSAVGGSGSAGGVQSSGTAQ